ncbi:MAG: DegT/DnrJ/EryC1/StrS family aminotransferase [Phycisphaerae bacterium]|nr:DegT/DnrJ/EryC1/StrS family aminotransferase [Phycisphaerae bacterium]
MPNAVAQVPLLDLKAQYAAIRNEIRPVLDEVCDSQMFILGQRVADFERSVAEYCGVDHAVGVSSGSDALILALMAADVGPGDEVITSTFTFFATAGAVARVGAKPILVDVDPETFNVRPDLIESAITQRTKAVIPVDLFGQLAELDRISAVAAAHRLVMIEDAAQSIGASRHGRKAGQFGGMCCFSFFPSKNLGGFGDGGMIVTDDADLAERCRVLRMHGETSRYHHRYIGGNFRLDALQAAILNVKLRHLDEWSQARRVNASRYDEWLAASDVITPTIADGNVSIFNQYTLRAPRRRDSLRNHLTSKGIGCGIYYPIPLHLQECFAYLGGRRGDCPVAEALADEVLSIPIYPELSLEQQRRVADAIREVCE